MTADQIASSHEICPTHPLYYRGHCASSHEECAICADRERQSRRADGLIRAMGGLNMYHAVPTRASILSEIPDDEPLRDRIADALCGLGYADFYRDVALAAMGWHLVVQGIVQREVCHG